MNMIKIDIGSTRTKVIFQDKEKLILSAITKINLPVGFSLSDKSYEYMGSNYMVGNVNVRNLTFRDYETIKKFQPLLIYVSLKQLGITETEDKILTISLSGLYQDKANEIRDYLEQGFEVNGKKIKFKEVRISLQGVGIYNALNLSGNVFIYDMGGHSKDSLFFVDKQLIGFSSFKGGSYDLARMLKTKLETRYDTEISEQQALNILINKELLIYGEKMNVTEIVDTTCKEWADKEKAFLKSEFGAKLSNNKVVLAGGSSRFMRYTKLPVGTIINSDEFLQVRGQ